MYHDNNPNTKINKKNEKSFRIAIFLFNIFIQEEMKKFILKNVAKDKNYLKQLIINWLVFKINNLAVMSLMFAKFLNEISLIFYRNFHICLKK